MATNHIHHLHMQEFEKMSAVVHRKDCVRVRVTKKEHEAFKERARELGVTVSDLLRQAGLSCRVRLVVTDSAAAYELRRIAAQLRQI